MKWYITLLVKLLAWSVDRLWDLVDTNNDGNISKEEIEEVIEIIRRRLTALKSKIN